MSSITTLQVLTDAYRAYRGKTTNFPAVGTAKYIDMLGILNRKQREWWTDNTVDWPSLFQIVTIGSTSSGTQTYDVDDDIIRQSDYVQLTDSNSNSKYISVVKPNVRSQYTQGCFFSGADPLQVTFITPITTSLSGLTITVGAYVAPDDLVNAGDTVAVDDPNWLIYSVAAELARNDYSKEEQYPNLNGIANTLYQEMIDNANANSYLQPNEVPNQMPNSDPLSTAVKGYGTLN